jgi:hypothetical protein
MPTPLLKLLPIGHGSASGGADEAGDTGMPDANNTPTH